MNLYFECMLFLMRPLQEQKGFEINSYLVLYLDMILLCWKVLEATVK